MHAVCIARGVSKTDRVYILNIINFSLLMQVAFGSDFSNAWSDEALGLKHVKGDGSLGFLMDYSLKGVQTAFRRPLHFVSRRIALHTASHICDCAT